jgi:hypothetical protein
MRYLSCLCAAAALLLSSCGGSDTKPAAEAPAAAKKAETPRPADETRHMPMTDFVDSKVVDKELMGKSFMPGGTVGHYKKGKKEWDLFLARMPSAETAATTLPDWRNALQDSKLVASYGGYFGMDNGKPVFVFSKGQWIAGVAGLNEKDADAVARPFAAKL